MPTITQRNCTAAPAPINLCPRNKQDLFSLGNALHTGFSRSFNSSTELFCLIRRFFFNFNNSQTILFDRLEKQSRLALGLNEPHFDNCCKDR